MPLQVPAKTKKGLINVSGEVLMHLLIKATRNSDRQQISSLFDIHSNCKLHIIQPIIRTHYSLFSRSHKEKEPQAHTLAENASIDDAEGLPSPEEHGNSTYKHME